LEDEELAELARSYKKLKDQAKIMEGKTDRIKKRLLTEMERRNTRGIVTGGMKITYVRPETTVYDPVRLRRALGKTNWEAATVRVVDKDRLGALIQEGAIDVAKVNRCASLVPKAAYPIVTLE